MMWQVSREGAVMRTLENSRNFTKANEETRYLACCYPHDTALTPAERMAEGSVRGWGAAALKHIYYSERCPNNDVDFKNSGHISLSLSHTHTHTHRMYIILQCKTKIILSNIIKCATCFGFFIKPSSGCE